MLKKDRRNHKNRYTYKENTAPPKLSHGQCSTGKLFYNKRIYVQMALRFCEKIFTLFNISIPMQIQHTTINQFHPKFILFQNYFKVR